MSQLKVNAISDAAGANGNAITLATDGTCTAKITNKSGHNLVTNGAFQIAQRSTSSTAQGLKTVDRWQYGGGGLDENPTQAQHALTSSDTGPWAKGFRYSYHLTNGNQTSGAGAADYVDMATRIEAQDIANSGWDYTSASSYITLSFWVKSSVAQNFYGFLKTADGTSQSYPFETGSLSANTWAKVTKKIPGNSNITVNNDNGEGLRITFTPFYGTDLTASSATLNTWAAFSGSAHTPDQTSTWYTTNDATFEITGVQLEVGDVATNFEHRSYGDELARCQRYYEALHMNAGTAMWYSWAHGSPQKMEYHYQVTKRAVPTSQLEGNASWTGATPLSFHTTNVAGFHHATTAYYLSDASGDLCYSFSAEL